jgi:hypothetical protein
VRFDRDDAYLRKEGPAAPHCSAATMGQIIQLPLILAGYPDNSAALGPTECILLIAIRGWEDCRNTRYHRMDNRRAARRVRYRENWWASFPAKAGLAVLARTQPRHWAGLN